MSRKLLSLWLPISQINSRSVGSLQESCDIFLALNCHANTHKSTIFCNGTCSFFLKKPVLTSGFYLYILLCYIVLTIIQIQKWRNICQALMPGYFWWFFWYSGKLCPWFKFWIRRLFISLHFSVKFSITVVFNCVIIWWDG